MMVVMVEGDDDVYETGGGCMILYHSPVSLHHVAESTRSFGVWNALGSPKSQRFLHPGILFYFWDV